jgi:hypothetical protein
MNIGAIGQLFLSKAAVPSRLLKIERKAHPNVHGRAGEGLEPKITMDYKL